MMVLSQNPETLNFETLFGSKSRVKIIKILAKHGELNISRIISSTRLNHATVDLHLTFLKDAGFVQEKDFGNIRIFRFKEENTKARGIKNLIKLIENH